MRSLFQPTLTRRVALSLVGSMALVWAVLLIFQFYELVRLEEGQHNPALIEAATELLDALEITTDPARAQLVSASVQRMIDGSRKRATLRGDVLIEVWDRQARQLVYRTPNLPVPIYRMAERNSSRWTVRVGQSRIDRSWLLQALIWDLTKYVLIALPILLIPVSLVVMLGLKPLRRLSNLLTARGPDDFSRLQFEPPHAELQPVVTSLNDLLQRVRSTVDRERSFVQDAAHELRTPLAVIAAEAHVLTKSTDDVERSTALSRLEGSLARASHMIRQLLDLARLESNSPADHTLTDIAARVRECLSTHTPAALARHIELECESPDELQRGVDLPALRCILDNLVDNAIRYGKEGGHVRVELHARTGSYEIVVEDDGPGIPQSERTKVFERFYRGQFVTASGTGLGLSIAQRAAARLGGDLRLCEARDGHGCRLELRVPSGE
jgi:two-component system sensor histidine kinase QseC